MVKSHLKFLFMVPAGWFLKTVELSALSFCLVLGMCDPILGADLNIRPRIFPESLTVGDKFLFVNTIDSASNMEIKPAPLTEKHGEASVISDMFRIDGKTPGEISYACTLAVYKPGEIELPSFVFNVTDSTGSTEGVIGKSLRVTINSILPADTSGLDLADIKEPMKLRGPIWPYLAGLLGLIMLVVLLIYIRRLIKRKVDIPAIPPRPPWEIALELLDKLKAENHAEFGRLKLFYFELTFIIRYYIERLYNFPAAEYTTYELENNSNLRGLNNNLYDRLFEMLNRADMVKFAKRVPDEKDAESDLKFAYDFVTGTIPVISEDAPGEKEVKELVK